MTNKCQLWLNNTHTAADDSNTYDDDDDDDDEDDGYDGDDDDDDDDVDPVTFISNDTKTNPDKHLRRRFMLS